MNEHDDELLSAYLDGETTADERALVERLLAERPEWRRTLDELAAVRQSLSSLPRLRLGEDLSERIVRRAERAMLSTASRGDGDLSAHDATRLERGAASRGARWPRGLRPWIYSGAAVAAALVIMIVSQGPPVGDARRVALAPARPMPASEMRAPESPAASAESDSDRVASANAAAAPSDLAVVERLENGRGVAGGGARLDASGGTVSDDRAAVAGFRILSTSFDELDDVLVVECELSPRAATEQRFQRLLAANAITLEEPPADEFASRAAPAEAPRDFEANAPLSVERRQRAELAAGESAAADGASLAAQVLDESGQPVEVVYVEATPEQLRSTLEQMAADHDDYTAVEVQPAPLAESQQSWRNFSRGRAAQNLRLDTLEGDMAEEAARVVEDSAEGSELKKAQLGRDVAASEAAPPLAGAVPATIAPPQAPPRAAEPRALADQERESLVRAKESAGQARLEMGDAVGQANVAAPPGGGIVTPPLQNRSWAQRVDANTQNIAAPAQSAAPPAAAPQQAARAATQDYQRAIFLLRVVPQETAR